MRGRPLGSSPVRYRGIEIVAGEETRAALGSP